MQGLDPERGGPLKIALRSRRVAWLLALIGMHIGRFWGRPLKLGNIVLVIRHRDVKAALARDLDYLIAPVNAPRFAELGFPFILGMDRDATLIRERDLLYQALSMVDMAPLIAAAREDARTRVATMMVQGQVDIIAVARPVAAATARRLFGIDADVDALMPVARTLFEHCFLNLGNDQAVAEAAHDAAHTMNGWLVAAISARRELADPGNDMLGALLRLGADDDTARRTLAGMLVGSIDTTATHVAKSLWVLASRPAWRNAARRDAGNLDRLHGWCQDALRRWTHVPLLTRQAIGSSKLNGTAVPDGAKLLLWSQAAMADPEVFPSPRSLAPDRPDRAYLHLGGGLHPCAGRGVVAWQVPVIASALLEAGLEQVSPPQWDGPFPNSMLAQMGEVA